MSEQTEKLKHAAQERLENVRQQLDKAKESLETTFDKTKSQVTEKIEEVKASLNETRRQVGKSRAGLKTEFKEHKNEFAQKVEHIKEAATAKLEERSQHKIIVRAEKAEQHARICIDNAVVAIAEAELACLEACKARMEAEEILAGAT
ncbi:MAG: hypothetical protein J7M40_20235 [Planctomycetes bacterium]|nr:hypothetical protein [Planctomycetota bacterium]